MSLFNSFVSHLQSQGTLDNSTSKSLKSIHKENIRSQKLNESIKKFEYINLMEESMAILLS